MNERSIPNNVFMRGDHLVFGKADRKKREVKSVMSPSAQITTQCETREETRSSFYQKVSSLLLNESKDRRLCAVVNLLVDEGLRVSEALNIKSSDVSVGLLVKIRGLKGSDDRFIKLVHDKSFWTKFRDSNCCIKDDLNRFRVYRVMKKYGISSVYGGNVRSSVTHSPRHEKGKDVYSISNDIQDVADVLGHKNIKSSEHYVR